LKNKAILVGPFIGELKLEILFFAPYVIYNRKLYPNHTFVVYTRPERRDLYGRYCDIFYPLDIGGKEDKYTIKGFSLKKYQDMVDVYKERLSLIYDIQDHIYPDISGWRYKLRWQFSRENIDYEFEPRAIHRTIVEDFLRNEKYKVLYDMDFNDKTVNLLDFNKFLDNIIDEENITYVGCLIELIKKFKMVVSSSLNDLAILGLLLKKDLVLANSLVNDDEIYLINRFKQKVFRVEKLNGDFVNENSV